MESAASMGVGPRAGAGHFGRPLELRAAARALRKLVDDPDDTSQVFHIIEALSGDAPVRMLRRVRREPEGRRLLASKPDLVPTLSDRDGLRARPAGSLAHAYLAFVESEGITAEGLVAASETGTPPPVRSIRDAADLEFLGERMRDTHDLWHAVTGWRGDLIGEVCLLAFTFAQTRNPGVGLIVAAGFVLEGGRLGVRRKIFDAFRAGHAARFLPAVSWEELLPLPLADVRRRLRIRPAPDYVPIRSHDLPRVRAGVAPA